MKKILFFLLSLPLLISAQETVTDIQAGEYITQVLGGSGKTYGVVWGGFLGVNRDSTASFGLTNIVQLGGGWHSGIVRDTIGAVYLVYKDNANQGKASYQTVPKDAYGNPFTGNTDCYGWMDAYLTLKNDSVYTFGVDLLGINGGKAIAAPMKLQQPPGKRVVKLQPIEPTSSPNNDILMALTSDNQIWIYPKGAKGVPYLKFTPSSPVVALGGVGQGVFIVATVTDILAWGGYSQIVGLPGNTQTPTSILPTFEKAGLRFLVKEIASDWNSAMILDITGNLFSIGDAVHGSTGVGREVADWRHHRYGTTAAPWSWNFQVMELSQPAAVWVPGKFAHVRNCIGQSFHYYAQDLGGNWYSCGRNKAGALLNGQEISNSDVFPEWGNVPMFTLIHPLTQTWPAGGGPAFDSTKTLAPRVSAGIYQYIATDTTTLYGMATQQSGSITGWSWTKISGPGTIVSPATATTAITGLNNSAPAIFRLTVKSIGGTVSSDIVVTSTASALPPAPVAKITADSTIIQSPRSFVRVSGDSSTGTGISYQWSQLGGPSAAIVTPVPGMKSGYLFSGLLPGTYNFQLQVTDGFGRNSLALVNVIVLPVPSCPVCPICPPPVVCPVIPPQRSVSGITIAINGQSFPIPVSWTKITYSDGSVQ